MTGAYIIGRIQDLANQVASHYRTPETAYVNLDAYEALLAYCTGKARVIPKGPKFAMVRDCTCGHPAGHHDDEPEGCWDCGCMAWGENQAQEPYRVELAPEFEPYEALRIHTDAGEVGVRVRGPANVLSILDTTGEHWSTVI